MKTPTATVLLKQSKGGPRLPGGIKLDGHLIPGVQSVNIEMAPGEPTVAVIRVYVTEVNTEDFKETD